MFSIVTMKIHDNCTPNLSTFIHQTDHGVCVVVLCSFFCWLTRKVAAATTLRFNEPPCLIVEVHLIKNQIKATRPFVHMCECSCLCDRWETLVCSSCCCFSSMQLWEWSCLESWVSLSDHQLAANQVIKTLWYPYLKPEMTSSFSEQLLKPFHWLSQRCVSH